MREAVELLEELVEAGPFVWWDFRENMEKISEVHDFLAPFFPGSLMKQEGS